MSGLFTKDIVVLDVTSRLISAIVGVKKAQSVFGIKSVVEKSHPGYEDGVFYDLAQTVRTVEEVLSEAMRNTNSHSRRLFIGVPAEFVTVVSKNVSLKFDRRRRIVDDDIDYLFAKGNDFADSAFALINTSAVYYAMDGDDKLYSDIRGFYADGIEACVSYMLAERTFIDTLDAIAKDLGFKDIRYVATNWAECVTLLESNQRESAFVLVDIGYLSSSVSLAQGEGVLDMKSFSVGGGHIAGDICEALEIPFDLAEEAKRSVDINLKYDNDAMLVSQYDEDGNLYEVKSCEAAQIAKGRLDLIAALLKGIIDGFGSAVPSYMPVYLTGEGIASMRGAIKYLSEKVGKELEIVMPKLPGFVKPEDSSKTSLMLIADTLAKRSFGDKIKSIFNGGKR